MNRSAAERRSDMLRFRGDRRWVTSVTGALTMALAVPCIAISQAKKPLPDLTGVWDRPPLTTGAAAAPAGESASVAANRPRGVGPDGVPFFGFSTDEPPMTPWAAEKYKAARS